jgi:hypothetical protein
VIYERASAVGRARRRVPSRFHADARSVFGSRHLACGGRGARRSL